MNDNSTNKCEDTESISFSWSYFIVFLASQVIAGAGGAPIFSLCIAYLDENVSPKRTSIFIAIYYVSGFLGPSIGFVIAGQLLSTYVDIDQVSEVWMINDKRTHVTCLMFLALNVLR